MYTGWNAFKKILPGKFKLILKIFTKGALGRIDEPSAGRLKDPVLKENRFLRSARRLGRNAMNFQNVPDQMLTCIL
jgi:hypothetical protein